MRAVVVSVDFADLLAVTLPLNRPHFEDVLIVTFRQDTQSARVAMENNCKVYRTDAFYRDGADFNKWLALEEGLDDFGRWGWLCLLDADIVWPHKLRVVDRPEGEVVGKGEKWEFKTKPVLEFECGGMLYGLPVGYLYSPLRRMWLEPTLPILQEKAWAGLPIHSNTAEWAGYTQIFHANDPHLGSAPWHETNWKHAGGADSFFQAKWPTECKVRPPWEVLHLGQAGLNWLGRATRRLDGSMPDQAEEKVTELRRLIRLRGRGDGRFKHEKLERPG